MLGLGEVVAERLPQVLVRGCEASYESVRNGGP